MERVGFVLKVKQERLAEYKARHKSVWPEMLAALRETGWRNYSLFLRDDGLLFGYLETDDFGQTWANVQLGISRTWMKPIPSRNWACTRGRLLP